MKLSDYVVEFLESKGIDTIFGYIGGMITHLSDSIAKNSNVTFIQVYHEQTAAFAAEGYALQKAVPGVAIATSGPGATNLVTGIANAFYDSVPVIYITGQVNTYEYKYDSSVRQQGFQETDVVSIVKPITKYAKLVDDVSQIRYELEKAYSIAIMGRPGPVLLDIPMDVQRADIDSSCLERYSYGKSENVLDNIDELIELIVESKRPLVLSGNGVIKSDSESDLKDFLVDYTLPVVTSLMGKSSVDYQSENCLGMIGTYGNRCANIAMANCDLLLVLGSRLDTRQTGSNLKSFLQDTKIIHVDIDAEELKNHRLQNRICVKADVKFFLNALLGKLNGWIIDSDWYEYLNFVKKSYDIEYDLKNNIENKAPYLFMQNLSMLSKADDVFFADVGQNQMWAAQAIQIKEGQSFYTSGGHAAMGYSIPAAVGAAIADKSRDYYAIAGDGGFHIALQSLMLISQYNLPIKVFVMNNNSLGMITQFQEAYFDNRQTGTSEEGGYLVPDLASIAKAYKLKYYKISDKDLESPLFTTEIMQSKNCIVEVYIPGKTRVFPKLQYDGSIENMSPKLNAEQLDSIVYENFIKNKEVS